MARKLTALSKVLITLAIVAAIFFGGQYILNSTGLGEQLKEDAKELGSDGSTTGTTTTSTSNSGTSSGDADLIVQVFTWGGYAPGFYFNEGFSPNSRSRFQKDYGIKVKFELIDDFNASREAWKADAVNLIGSTADALPTEMEGLGRYNPQVVFQCDWSRGGDAIVVTRGINSANDLRGKRIAYTPSTPSQTFLIKSLDAAGLTMKDIQPVDMPDNIAAATAFKANQVDAAVVWSPDDQDCVSKVPGAKVLLNTKQASNIIADVFVAKKSFVESNQALLQKFYEGWMVAAAELNANAGNKLKAAKIMAEGVGVPLDFAQGSIDNVRLTTHGDNKNFYGLNSSYKGVTGQELYDGMGRRFEQLGFASASRPDWRRTAYTGLVSRANLSGPEHNAEGQKTFTPPTAQDKTAAPISAKPLTINFATAKYALDPNAKTLIDLQLADIVKSYGNVRLRIEGNTDNVGNAASNKRLSERRAQSVADYLKDTYGINPNRLIIVGNGQDKPVKGCEANQNEACKAKNRRTELQLINS